jgi:hypothetical protein
MPGRADAPEITQSQFRRELLESGEVQRVVIVNKSRARVFMADRSS